MPSKKEMERLKEMFRLLDKQLDIEWDDAIQAAEKAIKYGKDHIGTDEDELEEGEEKR